ncbi:unnamed protein product [Phytophthora fragariaefolia]|uniref:Unnamed protein product n=1 Tax=Phytophthora fragariaefolia TaxID=1490495 RepID=A0A9W6Y0J0_9STRA|nr:unnamed protein product [Phytophthora fragariaefolia]
MSRSLPTAPYAGPDPQHGPTLKNGVTRKGLVEEKPPLWTLPIERDVVCVLHNPTAVSEAEAKHSAAISAPHWGPMHSCRELRLAIALGIRVTTCAVDPL